MPANPHPTRKPMDQMSTEEISRETLDLLRQFADVINRVGDMPGVGRMLGMSNGPIDTGMFAASKKR